LKKQKRNYKENGYQNEDKFKRLAINKPLFDNKNKSSIGYGY
jgi:hypothetical protein